MTPICLFTVVSIFQSLFFRYRLYSSFILLFTYSFFALIYLLATQKERKINLVTFSFF